MKKNFKLYLVAWVLLLAIFNLIAFLVPGTPTNEKFTASFWIGYGFITVMLIGQLVCAYMAFNQNDSKKVFYNITLVRSSYTGLVFSFIIGSICMIFSFLPYWIGVVVCAIVLLLNVMAIMKAKVAINEVERIDEKVKTQTFFIKSLTIDAETLMAGAKDDDIKAECRKVAEALRYSDPMSSDALSSIEGAISIKFTEFSNAVQANDKEKAIPTAGELVVLIGDRNKKCKLLK